jgi:hypothetical protein
MELQTLSPEQRADLKKQFEAEAAHEALRTKEDRQTYKKLVDEAIPDLFNELLGISAMLSATKTRIYKELESLVKLKAAVFGREDDQANHSFTTSDGITLMIGSRFNDGWDDTVTAGIDRVNKYLNSLVHDANSKILVAAIMKLMAKDAKGTLKASRVLQLKKIANDTGDKEFIDAVTIIAEAYRPIKTKSFVSCRYNNNAGDKVELPLDMTAAEFDFEMPAQYISNQSKTTENDNQTV